MPKNAYKLVGVVTDVLVVVVVVVVRMMIDRLANININRSSNTSP